MFLATASTKRPIAVTCLLIALIALGINSYRKIPLEQMPAVDIPYAVILTTWVGASPEDVEKDITKRIEDAVSGIDGLKTIESSSMENISQVQLEFNLSVDIDVAAQDIREKLDGVLADLPKDADRPVIQKVNINAIPIVNLFLTGSAPLDDLYEYADNQLSDRFATVPGVGSVKVIGGNEREVWIELHREKLAAAGLTSLEICSALQGGVLNLPAGNIREDGGELSVRFDAEYQSIPDIADIEVANSSGRRLKLGDLATIRQASKEVRERASLDGKKGIIIKVIKKAEGNTVAVVNETRRRFDEVLPALPSGMELQWVSDDAATIQAVVNSTFKSIFSAIILCAAILFLFLFNIRTTIIVGITMPITMVISLFFMYITGQSLNVVTLMAIGLSTGVLVSNSIVVLENIFSKFETMDDHWEAARLGTSEMTVAVLASAGTNVVVMFPIAMMTSLAGRFLAPFAITTLIVNSVSILISFTLTPILSALLLEPASKRKQTIFLRMAKAHDLWLQKGGGMLANLLRHLAASRTINLLIVLGFIGAFLLTMKFCGSRIGFNFIEIEDQARMTIRVELPPYYNLDSSIKRIDTIAQRISELPGNEHILVTVGSALATAGQANTGVYLGQIELFCVPKFQRSWDIFDRAQEIRKLLATETDCRISAGVSDAMGNRSYGIEYILTGDELKTIGTASTAIAEAARRLPIVETVESTVRDPKPEIRIVPKRAVLADLQMHPASLAALMRANIDGLQVADYRKGDRTYKIRVKLAEREGKPQIAQFLLPGNPGKPISLETVAEIVDSFTTIQIYRYNKMRGAKILGDVTKGSTVSEVGDKLRQQVQQNNLVPAGYKLEAGGDEKQMAETNADFGEAIILAAFLTLLTLCAILESWSRPLLVLITLPMGLMGVLISLFITGSNFSILVLLGVLMLIGIVVNSAILIVDKMGHFIKEGMARREAMFAALVDQFRPVLMVVLASGLGMLPLAMDTGLGAENRAGIGIASVGGVIMAGLLTITILPLCYTLFTKKTGIKKTE
jgi:hydrophobic/amphiphilic exporter-1 (mainly G- bacteria), HAE1 family